MAVAHKRMLYVGGLEESVDEKLLHAAFIPFGDIKEVQIPMDHAAGKHRGFGFVEFEEEEDAAAAIENMDDAELLGRVLKVNVAKPMAKKLGAARAVWEEADEWYRGKLKEDGFEDGVGAAEASAKLAQQTGEQNTPASK